MKSLVLLSSGLDSAVNLYQANKDTEVIGALTVDYGQKAAVKELEYSANLCRKLNIRNIIIQLPFFKDFTSTALVNRSEDIPSGESVQIHDQNQSEWSASRVWVPNRNGVFLNVAAAYAEGLGAKVVVVGYNLEEAQTFPDNTQEFLDQSNTAFAYSTQSKVTAMSYTTNLNKTEIVKRGLELGLDLKDVWPCYETGAQPCGKCESCQRFVNALTENGISKDEVWTN